MMKIRELSSHGILLISAIGNDGPTYGTLNNPADMAEVLGVGGSDLHYKVASFSSRDMTLHELPGGYGRFKPDLLAPSVGIVGLDAAGQNCEVRSGTSFGTPIVSGMAALLAGMLPKEKRNPAVLRQALMETATPVENTCLFAQGTGIVDLSRASSFVKEYRSEVTAHPSRLDLTRCPYMWPYCAQPLYYSAMPTIVNVTLINGFGRSGQLNHVEWSPKNASQPRVLDVWTEYWNSIEPWTMTLGVSISVTSQGSTFTGDVNGDLLLTFSTATESSFALTLPLRARVIPTPPRASKTKRLRLKGDGGLIETICLFN